MSIRAIAKDMYRAQQAVGKLEAELEKALSQDKEAILENLRQAKAEWQLLRNILNGEKAPSPFKHQIRFKTGI